MATTLSADDLRAAAEVLGAATRVVVVGAGLSGAVVLDAAYRLRALGIPVDAPADPLTAQLAAAQLPPTGACLAVSHTGATQTVVDAARRARATGAAVVALTGYALPAHRDRHPHPRRRRAGPRLRPGDHRQPHRPPDRGRRPDGHPAGEPGRGRGTGPRPLGRRDGGPRVLTPGAGAEASGRGGRRRRRGPRRGPFPESGPAGQSRCVGSLAW
ncbi:SIS domain-containing protein [Kitasatospora aburaviensis]